MWCSTLLNATASKLPSAKGSVRASATCPLRMGETRACGGDGLFGQVDTEVLTCVALINLAGTVPCRSRMSRRRNGARGRSETSNCRASACQPRSVNGLNAPCSVTRLSKYARSRSNAPASVNGSAPVSDQRQMRP